MVDIVKKGLLTAIGTASIARDKANKILSGISKKGLISRKQATTLVKRLARDAEKEGKKIQRIISAELKKDVKKARPLVKKGKSAVSKAKKNIKKASIRVEKRGKKVVRKIARRLR
ncbi:MAG: hypothetical protein U9O94_03920 [Nanoarchaeota archaeon]|nr:hypothetical protein [Nanoarchaeota archaeon]